MPWTVSRQVQWPEGNHVVEISEGGIDYTNPDALSPKYSGELEEYQDPREAVETALEIARDWQADSPDEEILIDHGATGGMTMPFDGMELNEETFAELRAWAQKAYEALPRCNQCGELLPAERYQFKNWATGEVFCRELCAERAYLEDRGDTVACSVCDREIYPGEAYDVEPIVYSSPWVDEPDVVLRFCSEACYDEKAELFNFCTRCDRDILRSYAEGEEQHFKYDRNDDSICLRCWASEEESSSN